MMRPPRPLLMLFFFYVFFFRRRAGCVGKTKRNETKRLQMRAALGLFDLEGEGWIAGDRLQALLFDASFRYVRMNFAFINHIFRVRSFPPCPTMIRYLRCVILVTSTLYRSGMYSTGSVHLDVATRAESSTRSSDVLIYEDQVYICIHHRGLFSFYVLA